MVWAFIFVSAKVTEPCISKMEYGSNTIYTCGVNTVKQGAQLAINLHDTENCELVELCGGFGEEGARIVSEYTRGKVRIGFVQKFKQ